MYLNKGEKTGKTGKSANSFRVCIDARCVDDTSDTGALQRKESLSEYIFSEDEALFLLANLKAGGALNDDLEMTQVVNNTGIFGRMAMTNINIFYTNAKMEEHSVEISKIPPIKADDSLYWTEEEAKEDLGDDHGVVTQKSAPDFGTYEQGAVFESISDTLKSMRGTGIKFIKGDPIDSEGKSANSFVLSLGYRKMGALKNSYVSFTMSEDKLKDFTNHLIRCGALDDEGGPTMDYVNFGLGEGAVVSADVCFYDAGRSGVEVTLAKLEPASGDDTLFWTVEEKELAEKESSLKGLTIFDVAKRGVNR